MKWILLFLMMTQLSACTGASHRFGALLKGMGDGLAGAASRRPANQNCYAEAPDAAGQQQVHCL